jgi:excisionase family DNA binding protein
MIKDTMSAKEAAIYCGVSTKTVLRWIEAGELKADKTGRSFSIACSDLEPFKRHDRRHDDHSGRTGDPATNGSRWTEDLSTVDSPQKVDEAPYLAGVVRDLQERLESTRAELTAKAEAAAMWQARAEILAAELSEARERLALPEGPKQDSGQETGDTGEPEQPRRPWWKFWEWGS